MCGDRHAGYDQENEDRVQDRVTEDAGMQGNAIEAGFVTVRIDQRTNERHVISSFQNVVISKTEGAGYARIVPATQ